MIQNGMRPSITVDALWECLILEGSQAGLSRIAILCKRETFRQAFPGFDPEKEALFDDDIAQKGGNFQSIQWDARRTMS